MAMGMGTAIGRGGLHCCDCCCLRLLHFLFLPVSVFRRRAGFSFVMREGCWGLGLGKLGAIIP